MRFLAAASRFAFVGTQATSRSVLPSSATLATHHVVLGGGLNFLTTTPSRASRSSMSRLFSSSSSPEDVQLRNIGKPEMEEILEDYEEGGREDSGYIVMDVREINEIEYTGKLSPNTQTLPLQLLASENVFAMDEEEFEEVCGFPKPQLDETLVFSCAAGVRSVHAAQFAAMNGYTQLVNYMGGANEWFR